jgi:hypothetical protein
MQSISTFSVTGGLAAAYIERGEMIPWSGVIAVEGTETGDNRGIAPGALEWRELPLPFMVQLENPVGGDGHDGAKLGGRIDTIERRDMDDNPDMKEIFATGFIDPTITPEARTFAEALDKGIMRGVSIDVDKVTTFDVAPTKDSGSRQIITKGRIMGLTGTPFQAFTEAFIGFDMERMNPIEDAIAASGAEGTTAFIWTPTDAIETIVASGGGSIPVAPPAAWFEKPAFTEYTPLTVNSNGQIYGHIAAWGTCHISFAGRCVPVPRSATNYAAFRNGTVVTAEGTSVRTGPIVMDTVHPDLRWKASDAMAFYADTSSAVCDVIPYEDKFGIVVAGALRPTVTPAQLRAFRGSDISPDWRTVDGKPREAVALLAVNNSGFKLPQTLVASAGMAIMPGEVAVAMDHDEVYALVASGPLADEEEDCGCDDDAVSFTVVTEDGDEVTVEVDIPVEAEEGLSRATRLALIQQRFGSSTRQFHVAAQPKVRVFGGGFKPFEKGHGKKKNPKPRPFGFVPFEKGHGKKKNPKPRPFGTRTFRKAEGE